MTREEILTALRDGALDVNEASALLGKSGGGGGSKRTIKRNVSGGLFVRDVSFEAYSEKKQKKYTASVNIPWEVASKLFTDKSLLAEVVKFVESQSKSAKKAG